METMLAEEGRWNPRIQRKNDKVRALHKGQAVSTLVRVGVHNVLIFHTEGTFC